MKKLLLSFFMLFTGFSLCGAMARRPAPQPALVPILYMPAMGCLELRDTINAQGQMTRGIIMHALINNPDLQAELQAVVDFDGQGPNLRTYQQIMDNLKNSTSSSTALAALKAFEQVIMHLYDFRVYAVGSYKPYVSIFVTGIKWSWINPINYLKPKSYISDNDPELTQLIDELANVAKVTTIHSLPEGKRMSLTVQSYRHWRRNVAIACSTYLFANLCAHGWKDSCLKNIKDNGLESTQEVLKTACSDTTNAALILCGTVHYLGKKAYNIANPCFQVIAHGVNHQEKANAKAQKALTELEVNARKAQEELEATARKTLEPNLVVCPN